MPIIGGILAILSHTVSCSFFSSFVADYFSHALFSFVFLLVLENDCHYLLRSVIGEAVVTVFVRTRHIGYTADGHRVFNSVLPNFNVLHIYADDTVGSQSSRQTFCIVLCGEALCWAGF